MSPTRTLWLLGCVRPPNNAWTQRLLVLLAALILVFGDAATAHAQAEVPDIEAPVTDLAGVLSAEAIGALSDEIWAHKEATGVQLAVLVINTTGGEPIEDYSLRVANRWQGGSEGRDDGVLFLLAVDDRRMRLEVGYGLEGHLPDAKAKAILDSAIPYLKSKSYNAAVNHIVSRVLAAATGPLTHDEYLASLPPPREPPWLEDEFRRIGAYALIFFFGSVIGRFVRWRADKARLTDKAQRADKAQLTGIAEPPPLPASGYVSLPARLSMGLYVVVAGSLVGLLGGNWFHYGGALIGMLAGWVFMWEWGVGFFTAFHYFGLAGGFSLAAAAAGTALTEDPAGGMIAAFFVQLLGISFYSNFGSSGTGFSAAGVSSGTSSSSSSTGSTDWSSSSSSSSWSSSSSSSSFGSSSSSFGSSSSSSGSSSSFSGGGGSFGGGGASSSW